MRELRVALREKRTALLVQERPCKPSRSTLLPQWHVCAKQMLAPRRKPIEMGSGRFGTRRFGNKMAEDVSATFCCRNVFGAETSSQQVKDVSATNFQYFPLLMWGHIRCMHARPHRRKDQLPLRSLRDLRFR